MGRRIQLIYLLKKVSIRTKIRLSIFNLNFCIYLLISAFALVLNSQIFWKRQYLTCCKNFERTKPKRF